MITVILPNKTVIDVAIDENNLYGPAQKWLIITNAQFEDQPGYIDRLENKRRLIFQRVCIKISDN